MPAGDNLNTIKAKTDAIKQYKAEIAKLYALEEKMTEAQFKQAEALETKTKKLESALKTQTKLLKESLTNFDDMDDTMLSIGNQLKQNNKFVKDQEIAFAAVKIATTSIAMELTNGGVANEKNKKKVIEATKAYKTMHNSIANINKDYAKGTITDVERIQSIRSQSESFKDILASVDMANISSEDLKNQLNAMGNEASSFAEAMKHSQINTGGVDRVFDTFSGIPAMGELNTLLKTNIRDTLAWKAAVFALGAALGKAAYDYFGAPVKAAMQVDTERRQNQIDGIKDIAKIETDAKSIPAKIGQEILEQEISANEDIRRLKIDSAYAGARAAIQFSSSMQAGAAQFERAAKTALFGNKIGSVGYGAAQLQLAGIGADKIASSMEAASTATGRMPSAKVGADMSIMAERTGASVDNIASISEMFQRMDGVSESTAMNLSEGLRTMAEQANIGLGGLVREIAEASKDALSYQIKSGPALAKQVAYAQSIGVSFSDVAKAGKSMVLNYKDSIKNEMQLSAMLGKSVDLSEVRSKFASGDTEGALAALKAQGLNPADMNMFQQEQLSQALGGMDLNTLQKIATNDGTNVGGLSEGNVKKGNQNFLSKTQSAEATLSSQQASISAKTAIIDAELSKKIGEAYLSDKGYADHQLKQAEAAAAAAKLATAMNDAWLATDAYKKSLSDTAQLNIVSGLKENLMTAGATLLGGVGTSLMNSLGGKAIGKIKEKFGGGGGASAPTAGGGGNSSPIVAAASAGAEAIVPGGGGVVESIASQIDAVEAPLERAMTMGEKLKDFGKGIGSFLKSIGTGVGSAIKAVLQGLGQGLISVSTGLVALTPAIPVMLAFGAAVLLTTPALMALAPVLIKIAEVIGTVLVEALQQAGPIITSIFNGIGTVIGSIGNAIATVITSIATSISMFAGMDAGALSSVAFSVGELALAVGAFGAGSVIGAIGSFFGGGVFDDLKDISSYANPIQMTANAVQSLANAFASLSSINTSALTKIPWGDMGDFASEGGKFVLASSGQGSFALSKETANHIKELNQKSNKNFDTSILRQNDMVALLAANSVLLEQIMNNTADGKAINLDGKKVNKGLLRTQRGSFGIGR
jgi:hypothetical protein